MYPERSRPVLTTLAYAEHQTVAGRVFSVQNLRKYTPQMGTL